MQSKHKKWIGVSLAILIVVSIASIALVQEKPPADAPGQAAADKDKAAIVDGTVIHWKDLDQEVTRIQAMLSRQGNAPSAAQVAEIRKDALENLIAVELLSNESRKQGLVTDEAAINKQFEAIKAQFPSETEFKETLTKMNTSEATVKSQIGRDMTINQLIEKEVVQKITISDKDTEAYYNGHADLFKEPEQVQASHILIKVDPKADKSQKEEAHKKLEAVQARLRKGEDFAAVAKEVSQCPSAAKGGDLGYFRRGQMVKPFEDTAFALKPGETSDIIETQFGYHIIKVADKKAAGTAKYETVKDKLGHFMKQEKIQKEVAQYVDKLKEKAKIERFLPEEPTTAAPAPTPTPAPAPTAPAPKNP